MRIGVDLRSLQEKQSAGIARYANQVCRYLMTIDKTNEYFFYFNTCQKVNYPDFVKQGIVVHSHLPSKLFNLLSWFKYSAWDKKNNLDIFWQPNFNFLHLSKKVKKVLTVHDLSWRINKRWYNRKMLWWHRLLNTKKLISRADKVVAISKSTLADLDWFYDLPKDKTEVIYSGVESDNSDLTEKISLPEKYILFIGAIEPRKNILSIIVALEKIYEENKNLQDVHLVIIGARGWLNKKIYKSINKSKYSDHWHCIGYTSDAVRDYYISNCLALIWPSFYEGFGHPPLEAFCYNKPVITSYNSSLPEVVSDQAILIDPYNIQGIVEAIKQVLNNYSEFSAEKKVASYNWQETAQQYLNIFNSIKK